VPLLWKQIPPSKREVPGPGGRAPSKSSAYILGDNEGWWMNGSQNKNKDRKSARNGDIHERLRYYKKWSA
jgi:hypothetical protein